VPTRFYLPSSGSSPVSVPTSAWPFVAANFAQYAAVTTPIGSALVDVINTQQYDYTDRVLLFQWVSAPLAAQVLTGQIKLSIRASRSLASQKIRFYAGIVSSAGVIRFSNEFGYNGQALTTVLSSKTENGDVSPSWSCNLDDRVWFQVGFNQDGTLKTYTFSIGDSAASDLPYAAGDTNAFNPWVETSAVINFNTPPPPTGGAANPLMLMGVGT